MADTNVTLNGMPRIHLSRIEANSDKDFARRDAVVAALEIIRAACLSGNSQAISEMKNLSKYADEIQEALKSSGNS